MRIPAHMRERLLKEAIGNGLKLLCYDTETSHAIVRTFYIGHSVHIAHSQVKVPNKVISIQYQWAHEKKAKYLMWEKVNNKFDDSRNFDDSLIIEEFSTNVLAKADIVLTQNGDRFDYLVLNERAKALHLHILDNKPSIDILKLSRKSFRSLSHKLDYRSNQQGLGGKIRMMDQDWVDIEEKFVPATKKMIPYGLKDTEDTLQLMWKELPYYKDLPVMVEKSILSYLTNSASDPKVQSPFCKSCRKKRRSSKEVSKTKSGYECNNCGENWS